MGERTGFFLLLHCIIFIDFVGNKYVVTNPVCFKYNQLLHSFNEHFTSEYLMNNCTYEIKINKIYILFNSQTWQTFLFCS